MRTLLLICAVLLMISGIVSANLWLELRNERQTMQTMRTQLVDARAAPRVSTPPLVVAAAPAPVVTVAAPAPAPSECKPVAENAPRAAVVANPNPPISERELLKDPDYRKVRLAQRRLELQRSNPDVAEALGLSPRDADKLLDLLAEYQVRSSELPPVTVQNPRDAQAANAEMTRNRLALQKQQDEAVTALLGTAGMAQWQEYQGTRGARSQAASMGAQLLQVGQPLTSAQLKPLTAALVAEQQRQRLEVQPRASTTMADPQAREAAQEEAQRRAEESNRRLLAAIAPSLNPQQLAVFREQFEVQAEMNAVAARARARASALRGAQ